MIRTFLLMALGIAFIVWAAGVFWDLAATDNSDIVQGLAEDAIGKVENLTGQPVPGLDRGGAKATATPSDGPIELQIVATGGTGVALRSDCDDGARVGGALAEGALVTLQETGSERCLGWSLVAFERIDGVTTSTWVRDAYLDLATTP